MSAAMSLLKRMLFAGSLLHPVQKLQPLQPHAMNTHVLTKTKPPASIRHSSHCVKLNVTKVDAYKNCIMLPPGASTPCLPL
jgi:hypothetical protein